MLVVLDDQPVALALGDLATDDVVVAHEPRDDLGRGLRGDRQRIGDLLDARLIHDDDAVGHRERLFLIVRHVDEHQAELALEVAQLDAHPQLEEAVEVAERLVEQQRFRLGDEDPRQRHPLLLASGQGAWLTLGETGEADHLERLECELPPFGLADPVHLEPELDVLERRAVGEEREVLEDGGRRALVRGQIDKRLAVEHDVAFGWILVAADHPQRRCLAAAGRPEQDDVFTVVDVQVDVFDGDRSAGEDLGQPDEVEP